MNEHQDRSTMTPTEVLVRQQEHRASRRLEKLYDESKGLKATDTDPVVSIIEKATNPAERIERKILTKLAEVDGEVLAILENVKVAQQELTAAATVAEQTGEVAHSLDGKLSALLPYLDTYQSELWNTVKTGRYMEDVVGAMRSLAESLNSSESLWSVVLKTDKLPSFLVETELENGERVSYIESISFWIDLQAVVTELDERLANEPDKKKRRLLRTKVFTEMLKDRTHFLSPAIMEDLVEERYDETDSWIGNNIFDTFLSFDEEVQKHERKLTPTQKRLLAIVIATMIGVAVTMAGGEKLQSQVRSTLGVDKDKTEQVDEAAPEAQEEQAEGAGGETATGANEQGPVDQPPQLERSSSPENSGEFPQGIVWHIEGEIPPGYLRTETAAVFYTNPSWEMRGGGGTDTYLPQQSNEAVTFFLSDFTVTEPGVYPIPMPYEGYRVVSLDLGTGQYSVRTDEQGTAVLVVRSIDGPSQARIGLGHANVEVTDPVIDNELYYGSLIGEISSLPQEAQQILQEVEGLPVVERAERITAFVHDYFTYSLDPQYSDYQRAVSGRGEFIRRIFAMPYGDCDVINTVNVGLLRAAGVPARMAYGYMNDSSLLSTGGDTVDRGESHGWAEYYNGSEWVPADATPSNVDEYTRERLQGRNGGSGIGEVKDLNQLGDVLKMQMLLFMDWLRTFGLSTGALSIFATYVVSWVALSRSRKNQEKRLLSLTERTKVARPKTGMTAFEQRLIPFLIEDEINVKNMSERNISFRNFIFDYGTVLPVFIMNRIRNRKISQAEKALDDIDPKTLEGYNFYELMTDVIGVSPQRLSERIIDANAGSNNFSYYLSPFFERFYKSVGDNLGQESYFIPKGFKYMNDSERMMEIAEKSPTLPDFLNTIVGLYYEAYVKDHQKKSRQKNVSMPRLVTLEQFTRATVSDFSILVNFYNHLQMVEKVKADRASLQHNPAMGDTQTE